MSNSWGILHKFLWPYQKNWTLLCINLSNVLTKWWTKGTFWEWLISTYIIAIQINNDIWQWCRNRNSGGGSFSPIPTEKGRLFPLITTGTLKVFHFPASLFDLITTSFHERWILNSEISRFHRFYFFRSQVYFISIWFNRGFCEDILKG